MLENTVSDSGVGDRDADAGGVKTWSAVYYSEVADRGVACENGDRGFILFSFCVDDGV